MDTFNRNWITVNAIEALSIYKPGSITLRGLHYLLVSRGMTNSLNHYKRVIAAMTQARWEGVVKFDMFADHDRPMVGMTKAEPIILEEEIETAKGAIEDWMNHYLLNRWQNQAYYPEVFIEKKALQGTFEPICNRWKVALGPCKGYPSLTFLHKSYTRFKIAENRGQTPIILYFGDYDPSGEDIPRSIRDNLIEFGIEVEVRRIALMEDQVLAWDLPPAPTKKGDSRSGNWDGIGQVELDAVEPRKLQSLCSTAIERVFDEDKYEELKEQQSEETEPYRKALKEFVKTL